MRIVGIVIEANPFHNGHQYLIDQCKIQYNPDLIVGVCSGYFTMRGEISVLSKYDKTQILLDAGFDLIIDLPTACYLNSSQKFAENSIYLLNEVGITDLVFGVENCTIADLKQIVEIENSSSFKEHFLQNTKKLFSHKIAYAETILELSENQKLKEISLKPNNTLALEYLKAILKINSKINAHSIQRIGSDDNNIELNNFPSGTALRKGLLEDKDISNYINYSTDYFIDAQKAYNNLNTLYKYLKLSEPKKYEQMLLVKEGIHNYILNNYNFNLSLEDNLHLLANKKYSKSRIRRTLLSMLLEIPNTLKDEIPIRILGFSKKAENYLYLLKDKTTNVKVPNIYNNIEIKTAKLYSTIINNDLVISEFKFPRKGE